MSGMVIGAAVFIAGMFFGILIGGILGVASEVIVNQETDDKGDTPCGSDD